MYVCNVSESVWVNVELCAVWVVVDILREWGAEGVTVCFV